jgi:hypothetical protein
MARPLADVTTEDIPLAFAGSSVHTEPYGSV